MTEKVLDARALSELLLGGDLAHQVRALVSDRALHAPAHIDAEVLALLQEKLSTDQVSEAQVLRALQYLASAPITRHQLAPLAEGAWRRHDELDVDDALYVELAQALKIRLVSTNEELREIELVDFVEAVQ